MKILHKKPGIKGAFTLIELLVVISIIGLLSSVVLVSLQSARAKAVNARILQEAGQLRNSFELGRTNTGYTSLSSSGSSGIAAYGSMSTEMQGLVNDILKQQGKTIATLGAYPGGSAGCSAPLSQTGAEGVIVTTEATACGTTPTGYAIYAANSPVGTAGYTCIDSRGGRGSATSGGIVLNSTAGVCSGTVSGGGGGGGGSLALPDVQAIYPYADEQPGYNIIRFHVSNSDTYEPYGVGGTCSLVVTTNNNGAYAMGNTQYTNNVVPGNLGADFYVIDVFSPTNVSGWDVTVQATCTVGTNTVVGYGSQGE